MKIRVVDIDGVVRRVSGYELRVPGFRGTGEGKAVSAGTVEQEIRWRMGRVVGGALERLRRTAPAFGLKGGVVKNAMENRKAIFVAGDSLVEGGQGQSR